MNQLPDPSRDDYDKLRASAANRSLRQIMVELVRPSVTIQEWLAEHGGGCACVFCCEHGSPYSDDVAEALAALQWMMAAAVGALASCTPGPPPEVPSEPKPGPPPAVKLFTATDPPPERNSAL